MDSKIDKKEKILIIEDDVDFRFTLVRALKRQGYYVECASNCDEAIEKAKECHFEIVISDIKLPGRDGIDAVIEIKQMQLPERTTIIIMTGFSDKESLVRAIKLGVDDYIAKPFTMEEFYHCVEQNVKNFQLEKDKHEYVKKIQEYNALLTDKNEYMDALLLSLAEGFFTVNNEWEITQFNRIAEKITGYKEEEVLGKKCKDVFQSELCKNKCPLDAAIKYDTPVLTVETNVIKKNGKTVPIILSASSIKDSNRQIIGGVEVIRDISEFKRMTKEIEDSREKIQKWGEELERSVKKRTNELTLICNVSQEISTSLKIEEALNNITSKVCDVLDIEICSILLLDNAKEYLSIVAARGLSEDTVKTTKIKNGERISGWVVKNNRPLLVNDVSSDPRFTQRRQEKYYSNSFISIPLAFKNEVIGVINVNNKVSKKSFNENDFNLINGIAQQASIVIENARLYSSLKDTYMNVVMSLMTAVDAKDHYTNWHSHQVTAFGVELAREMNLSDEEIEIIRKACMLHDIGKIAVHDNILTKESFLTDSERSEMQTHPIKSAEIVKPLSFLDEVGAIIKQHHERFDGKGYPYNLKGDDLLIGARIMAVVDSFSAMVSRRPYRKTPLTKEQAKSELVKNKGTQFDPVVVDAFVKVLEKHPDIISQDS
ncbi:MAG: response regulator [Candidatus Omnitrophica bacterium]|nr:response regulator [Candidatus Omnitrophota bacterium]